MKKEEIIELIIQQGHDNEINRAKALEVLNLYTPNDEEFDDMYLNVRTYTAIVYVCVYLLERILNVDNNKAREMIRRGA